MRCFLFDSHNTVGTWVWNKFDQKWRIGQGTAIGVYDFEKQAIIGGVTYHAYNGVEVWVSAAGEKENNWLTRDLLHYIFHYPLVQLGVKNLRARITSNNEDSVNLVERLGFTLEARCVDAEPDGDVLVYRINKQEAQRWIKNG